MRPSLALALHRDRLVETLARHHLANPRVFGSVLRGDDGDSSDLDILVEAGEEVSLLDLVRATRELQGVAGVPVDLVTPEDLGQRFRARVLAEARPL